MGRTITLRPQNFSSNAPNTCAPAVGCEGAVSFGGNGSLRDNYDSTYVLVGSLSETSRARADYILDDLALAANERPVDMRYRCRRASATSASCDADVMIFIPSLGGTLIGMAIDKAGTSYANVDGAYFVPSAGSFALVNEWQYRIVANAGTSVRPVVSEGYIDIRTNYAPTANITGPAGDQERTGLAVEWTTYDPEGDAQAGYQVRLFTAAQYLAAGFNPSTSTATFDTGNVSGMANRHDLPSPLASGDYRVYVRLRDAHGFGTWSYSAFSANDFLKVDAGLGVEGFVGEVLNLDGTVTGSEVAPGYPTFVALPSRSPAGATNSAVTSVTLDVGTGNPEDLVLLVVAARASLVTNMTAAAEWTRIVYSNHTADDVSLGIWTARRRNITDTTPTVTFTGSASQHAAACYVARPAIGRDVAVSASAAQGSGATANSRWTVAGNTVAAGTRTLTLPLVALRPSGTTATSVIDAYEGFTERLDMGADWMSLALYDLPFEGSAAAWGGNLSNPCTWISRRLTIIDQPLPAGAPSLQWTGDGLTFGSPTAEDTTVQAAGPGTYVATLTANGAVADFATVHFMEVPPVGTGLLPVLTVEIDGRANPSAWTDPGDEWKIISGTNPLRHINTREGQRTTYGPCEPTEITLKLANDNGYLDKGHKGEVVGLVEVGLHPRAKLQATAEGRRLRVAFFWQGRLYFGYGDTAANTGPIYWSSYSPATGTWSDGIALNTEAIYNIRPMGTVMRVPYADPRSTQHYASTTTTHSTSQSPASGLSFNHAYDITGPRADGALFLAGQRSSDGFPLVGAILGTYGSASWVTALAPPYVQDTRNGVTHTWSRFGAIAMLGDVAYTSLTGGTATDAEQDGGFPAFRIHPNNTTDQLGPVFGGFVKPVNFGGRLVYRTKKLGGDLRSFDGTTVAGLLSGGSVKDHYVEGSTLYAVVADQLLSTTDMTTWTTVGSAPPDTTSLAVLNGMPYFGTSEARVWTGIAGFTPTPYNSYLTEGRQVRVRTGGLEIGRGNVEAWPQEWETFVDPTITLQLTDVLGELGRTALAQTLFEHQAERGVAYPKPVHLWPGTEKITGADASIADVIGGLDYTPTGAPPSASGSQLVPYSDIAGMQGNRGPASTPGSAVVPSTFVDDNGPWTLFGVVAAPAYQNNVSHHTSPFSCRTAGNVNTKFWPAILTNTAVAKIIPALRIENTAGTRWEASGSTDMGNQSPTLMFVRHDPTTKTVTMRVHNLGLPNAPETLSLTYTGTLDAFNPTDLFLLMAGTPGTSAAMTAFWPVRLTDAQVELISDDISAPWRGDNADERLNRLLDMAVPGIARNIDVAAEEMLPVSLKGRPALDVGRRTVASTGGRMWAQSGAIQFRNRDHAPAPVAAFGVGGIPIQKLKLTDGSADRATHITVENEAGSRRVYHDAAASAAKGERRLTIDTTLRYSNDMVALGERTAEQRSTSTDYVRSITITSASPNVDIVEVLRVHMYDRITVAFRRPWSSTVETQTLEVVGREHDGDAQGKGVWTATFHLRPV